MQQLGSHIDQIGVAAGAGGGVAVDCSDELTLFAGHGDAGMMRGGVEIVEGLEG